MSSSTSWWVVFTFVFGAVGVVCQPQSSFVSVTTSYGTVQGKSVDLGNDRNQLYNGKSNVFLGIPYAQPPVGNRRFQPPQPVQNFNRVYDATYYRPKCPQANVGYYVNEDCLYLNVFSQQVGNKSASMAVMVLIDGSGGFNSGGQDESQLKGTISNLAQRGIVVVSLQYRLGALGFFTTYSQVVQPNLGLLDQVQALRWVNTQIRYFGGDPNRVTVCGQGDGACAVSAHTLSPMSQNLFQQAIIQSGSIYSCYSPTTSATAVQPSYVQSIPVLSYDSGLPYTPIGQPPQQQPPQNFPQQQNYQTSPPPSSQTQFSDPNQQIANQLCNVSPQQWSSGQMGDLNSCLQNYTIDFFMQQQGSTTATWLIVRDNNFLPDSIQNLAARRPPIPIIIGTVQDENADYAFKLISNGVGGSSPTDAFNSWMFDYAQQNKLDPSAANQVASVISSNYNVPTATNNNNNNYPGNANVNTNLSPFYDSIYPNQNQNAQFNNQDQPQQYGQTPNGQNQQFNNGQYSSQQYGPPIVQNQQYPPQQTGQPQQYGPPPNGQNQQFGPLGVQNQQFPPQSTQYPSNQQFRDPQQQQQFGPPAVYNPSSTSSSTAPGGVDVQSMEMITQIASDASVSLTATQVDDFMQNGDRHVRIYQFTHVSNVGRNTVPNTGSWQPVFKGQDTYFLTMSETVWSNSNYTAADRNVANDVGQRWTDFVKTGQVNSWQPSTPQNYNYCSLNQQPTQQNNYAQQARDVFVQQVNPIIAQAQQQQQPPQRQPQQPPNPQNSATPNQNVHISITMQNLPRNG